MDIKLIVRALQLDDEQWEEHLDLIGKLRLLTDAERTQLAALGPVKKPTTKKSAGKGGGGKSKHASSLQQQIQAGTAARSLDGGVSKMRCDREGCGEYADHNKHHLTTDPDFHEFQPAVTSATGSRDAGGDALDAMRAASGE